MAMVEKSVEHGRAQLISCNGNPFASFADLAQDISAAVPKYSPDRPRWRDRLRGQTREAAISGLAVPPRGAANNSSFLAQAKLSRADAPYGPMV